MQTVMLDVRYAVRLLMRNPGFTAVALLALALGIGANSVMFSVVNAVLLHPLSFPHSDRLLFAFSSNPEKGARVWGTSPPDFYAMRERNRSFEQLASIQGRSFNVTGSGQPERVRGATVSSNYFATLGVQPRLGRGFTLDDEVWGRNRVLIISDGMWRQRFAAAPDIAGRTLDLNGERYTIVGVMPPGFQFFGPEAQLWTPMSFAAGDNQNSHNNYFLFMVGRLKPSVTLQQARADLQAIAADIAEKFPENRGITADVTTLREQVVGEVQTAVLVLMGAVGFVLLIACANLANLLLARAASRRKEIAVRAALGARRSRLVRQFLTESVLLGVLAGVIGLLLAYWGMEAVHLVGPRVLPRVENVQLDWRVLLFTLGVSLLTAVLFGIIPALHGSRANLDDALKSGGRADDARGRHRARSALVVSEVALAVMLLIGAGLMAKSLQQLLAVDAGFRPDSVLTLQFSLPASKYVDSELEKRFDRRAYVRASTFLQDAIDRVRQLPGVRSVAAASTLPLSGNNWGKTLTLYDRPLPTKIADLPNMQFRLVAGDYFRTLGIKIVKGRALDDHDTLATPNVAVVSQELVQRFWKGEDPIGKVISVNPPVQLIPTGTVPAGYAGPEKYTVVGVADDVRYGPITQPQGPVVYVTYAQSGDWTSMFMIVQTDSDPLSTVNAVRQQIWSLDKDQPVANVATMQQIVSSSVAQPRLEAVLLSVFAGLAMLLAAIGIYGVMSYAVTQRTREIGIRMALGAAQRDVLQMIVKHGLAMTVAGLAIGLGGAFALTRVMKALLFAVSTTDPVVFAGISLALALVALLASYLPARRATQVDPLIALRYE